MKKWCSLAMLIVMIIVMTKAFAEKRNVTMGKELKTLPILEYYDENIEYFFDYEDIKKPMATVFLTGENDSWYKFTVTNHSMNNTGWSIDYGLLTRVFPFDTSNPTKNQTELNRVYICTNQGKANTQTFYLRLDADSEYVLNFNAISTTSGTVSFIVEEKKDPEGESMADAAQLIHGTNGLHLMAAHEDIDYYKIDGFSSDVQVGFHIKNRINASNLSFKLYDSFKELIHEAYCPYNEDVHIETVIEADTNYYVRIEQNGKQRSEGRYELGFCYDGCHLLGEERIIQEANCSSVGYAGKQCEICAGVFERIVIPQNSHQPGSFLVEERPDCVQQGMKRQRCTACDTVLAEDIIMPLGHQYSEFIETVSPTRSSEGFSVSECSNCGDQRTKTIPKLTIIEAIFGR